MPPTQLCIDFAYTIRRRYEDFILVYIIFNFIHIITMKNTSAWPNNFIYKMPNSLLKLLLLYK